MRIMHGRNVIFLKRNKDDFNEIRLKSRFLKMICFAKFWAESC